MLKYFQNRGYLHTWVIVLGLSVASFLFAFGARAGENHSNDTNTSSFNSTSTGSIYIKAFRANQTCREYEGEIGTFKMNIYDDTLNEYLGTSTIYNIADIEYQTSMASCTPFDFVFPEAVAVENGHEIQFQIHENSDNSIGYYYTNCDSEYTFKAGTVPFGDYWGDISYNPSYCASGQIFDTFGWMMENGEFGEEGDTLSDTCPDVLGVNNVCFMGEDCNIEYYYNDLFVESGGTVYLSLGGTLLESLNDTPAKNLYNESTITLDWDYFEGLATGTKFNLCLDAYITSTSSECYFGLDNWRECEFEVIYYDREQYEAGFRAEMDAIFEEYASTSPNQCDDLCDEETGLIACGLKKAGCWAFAPSITSQQKFVDSLLLFEKQFPYSVVNQIITLFSTTTTSFTATSTALTMNWTTFGLPKDETLTIFSENMMSDTWGETWDIIYDIQEKIVYFFFLLFLIYFVIKSGFGADISSLFRKNPSAPENVKDYTVDLRARAYGTSHGTEIINLRK